MGFSKIYLRMCEMKFISIHSARFLAVEYLFARPTQLSSYRSAKFQQGTI
jgi:hypothetical protein